MPLPGDLAAAATPPRCLGRAGVGALGLADLSWKEETVSKNLTLVVSVWAVLALVAPAALAGRPLATSDAGTADEGSVEVEIGAQYQSGNVASKMVETSLALTYGLTGNVEVGVAAGGVAYGRDGDDDITGMGDSEVAAMWRFYENESGTTGAALGAAVSLPTGDVSKDLGSDDYDISANLILSWEPTPDWCLAVNGGYAWLMTESDIVTGSAAASRQVTDSLALVGEVVHEQSPYGIRRDKCSHVLLGGVLGLAENVDLDMAVGFGLDSRTPDVLAILGVTIIL